jgi:hypothetical protein
MPEADVSQDKLRDLLAERAESAALEFIGACDPSNRRDIVELASEVGALAARGGWIVVGSDDHGRLTGNLTEEHARQFDDATLRDKLARYLPSVDLRVGRHTLDSKRVVLICVEAHPDGAVVFAADGAYEYGGKQQVAFRAGEMFVRHGSKSERPNQADITRIARAAIERARLWLEEIAQVEQAISEIGVAARAEAQAYPDGRMGGFGRDTGIPTMRRRLASRLAALESVGGPELPECRALAESSHFVFYNQVIGAVFSAMDEIARAAEQHASTSPIR